MEEATAPNIWALYTTRTALATNNYILVGGGGWGSVEHCLLNRARTHMHCHTRKHLSEVTTSK